MHDLRLVGVHEDGLHLLLSDGDGGRYRVPPHEPLRAAVRRDRPHLGQLQIEIEGGMRPREVQSLIRSGLSTQEVADRAGWTPEKVRRYEGPILAEREYVAGLAQQVRMRDRQDSGNSSLSQRVHERLRGRGVDPSVAAWDAGRNEDGQWQVRVHFAAGGRERTASWWFDLEGRSVVPADDEARWLSEDSDAVAGPVPHNSALGSPSKVYDVEAEGGIDHVRPRDRRADDIETALRASSTRRRRGSRRNQPTLTAVDDSPREDALPLESVAFDPATSEPPPAAHGVHPLDAEPVLPVDVATGSDDAESDVDDEANAPATATEDDPDAPVVEEDETAEPDEKAEPAPVEAVQGPARMGAAREAGRRSVPSWDDIMFGPGGTGS
jgi:hypothetical protein